ncbi:hypothetical protein BJ138DRAFT_1152050 [Hygrophoropsis aurantiaca]|uniref:Uncharacterized protein n=1 Tax=Hygrophoropsis aurantiaca TaxID=72124 RepID=A0ACB8ABE4_9AGAM|nr:hypothetical protein BJ138DRAFT_1152050 [Hygrophoropsis aurantiaca]
MIHELRPETPTNSGGGSDGPSTPGPVDLGIVIHSREGVTKEHDTSPSRERPSENKCGTGLFRKEGASGSCPSIFPRAAIAASPNQKLQAKGISGDKRILDSSRSKLRKAGLTDDDPIKESKKRKRGELDLPPSLSHTEIPELSATLRRTNYLLENWSSDPREVLSTLKYSLYFPCPEFPESELRKIIAGSAVNLDAVFSEFMDQYGVSRTSIATGLDWCAAWAITEQVYSFVFPFRADEFKEHGYYITKMFSRHQTNFHFRIISFEKEARERIGSCRKYDFTDVRKFDGIFASYFLPCGIHFNERPPRRKNACRRYNSGMCPRSGESCRYGHFCSSCRGDHKIKDCGAVN